MAGHRVDGGNAAAGGDGSTVRPRQGTMCACLAKGESERACAQLACLLCMQAVTGEGAEEMAGKGRTRMIRPVAVSHEAVECEQKECEHS